MQILDGLAIVISFTALLFSLIQFFSTQKRNRQEATIHAFDELEETVFASEGYKKLPIRAGTNFALAQSDETDISVWNEATIALSKLEHFAVGINTKIYDINTLNRLAGGFIINEYSRWLPIINTKRINSPEVKHYDEFERMANSLKKIRK